MPSGEKMGDELYTLSSADSSGMDPVAAREKLRVSEASKTVAGSKDAPPISHTPCFLAASLSNRMLSLSVCATSNSLLVSGVHPMRSAYFRNDPVA